MKLSEYAVQIRKALHLKHRLGVDLVGGKVKFIIHEKDLDTAKEPIKVAIKSANTGEALLINHDARNVKSILLSPAAFEKLLDESGLIFTVSDVVLSYYKHILAKEPRFDQFALGQGGIDLSEVNHHPEFWRSSYRNNTIDNNFLRRLVQAQTLSYIKEKDAAKDIYPAMLRQDKDLTGETTISNVTLGFTVEVVEKDCLEAAAKLVRSGKNVLLLNMANQFVPGGGYKKGSGAQEGDLFRRTTLVESLSETLYEKRRVKSEKGGIGEFGVLYSEKVRVLRRGRKKGYVFYPEDKQFDISVISSAAYNLNAGKSTVKSGSPKYNAGMKHKIRNQLRVAVQFEHRNLVLSAFGCGSFQNNPVTVASFYQKVLCEQEFAHKFDLVQFAIPCGPGQPTDVNFDAFSRQLDASSVQSKAKSTGARTRKNLSKRGSMAIPLSALGPGRGAKHRPRGVRMSKLPPYQAPGAPGNTLPQTNNSSADATLPGNQTDTSTDNAALDAAFTKHSMGVTSLRWPDGLRDFRPLTKNLLEVVKKTQVQHAKVCKRFTAWFFPRHHHGKEGIKRGEEFYKLCENVMSIAKLCEFINKSLKISNGNKHMSSFKTLLMKNIHERFNYKELENQDVDAFDKHLLKIVKEDYVLRGAQNISEHTMR